MAEVHLSRPEDSSFEVRPLTIVLLAFQLCEAGPTIPGWDRYVANRCHSEGRVSLPLILDSRELGKSVARRETYGKKNAKVA